ncbi:MAG: glutamine synthetase [Spirochaetales bacterium]|nr:glutamine synthetase [Spirochaetales bacterium]MBQ3728303.1 glutamine synthetase [Spirochaetales bacterium]MBQ3830514.1 glutamine synthetase [Spirochaetales bacterium]MBQ4501832.1 glutamine synthetase [Spirochaetales bacterium]
MDSKTRDRIMAFIEEQDVRFVKLAFCDIFGQLKNISISAKSLPKAMERGVGLNAASIRGFLNIDDSDLLLFPDPDTLTILPWRPADGKVARFFCEIRQSDGSLFDGDVRSMLKTYEKSLIKSKISLQARTEIEFYLFKKDADGNPTDIPMDRASYFEAAPIDKGENIRREICLNMEQMGITYVASHHEKGPGQNEIRFSPAPLLDAADHLVTFKDIVKITADRMGLFASFLPKPLFNENGSGLAISLSLDKAKAADRGALARQMTGGILRRIEEITLFLNPIANSYERIGTFEAPFAVNYGLGNGNYLIKTHPEAARVKVRSTDPSCNPYLACLLLAGAAMEGIRDNLNPDDFQTGSELPDTLNDAIKRAEKSEFVTTMIPQVLFEKFLQAKRDDWLESSLSGDPMLKAKNMEFPVT